MANVVIREALFTAVSLLSFSATIRNSHPNRFLIESIRSMTKRPLELSTDRVFAGHGDDLSAIIQHQRRRRSRCRRHIPVIKPLRITTDLSRCSPVVVNIVAFNVIHGGGDEGSFNA